MNSFVIIAVVLSMVGLSYQDGDHAAFIEKMRAARDDCIKETGVDKDLVTKALQDNQFAEDSKLKCYFKCVYQKLGRMDASGNMDPTALGAHLPEKIDKTKAMDILTKCKDKKSPDACQTAFEVAKCMREAFGTIKHD